MPQISDSNVFIECTTTGHFSCKTNRYMKTFSPQSYFATVQYPSKKPLPYDDIIREAARCAAEQTQTVTRQSSTITIAPIQGKEKSPELDDGGTGLPPRDDDGGGGGGGGGGPGWTGGFFFFGLLAFLGFLKDDESERHYNSDDRRR
ncbi:hypothetical protein ACLOJK_036776 [Asimina triloba]